MWQIIYLSIPNKSASAKHNLTKNNLTKNQKEKKNDKV